MLGAPPITGAVSFSDTEMEVIRTLSATVPYDKRAAFLFPIGQELQRHGDPPYGEGKVHACGVRVRPQLTARSKGVAIDGRR